MITFLANEINATDRDVTGPPEQVQILRTEFTKSHLNNRICQHCGVKTSTVTPSFYYVLKTSLSCNDNIPSFIGNVWRVLLLGNQP